ncbi:MAG TPA: phosphoethanolamine--lipid A transferase [Solimonas sp.]|nr:phosphoethanolamine--lipid A transferase [Solimonas sp.]
MPSLLPSSPCTNPARSFRGWLPVLPANGLLLLVVTWIAGTQNQLLWLEVWKSVAGLATPQAAGILAAVALTLFSGTLLVAALLGTRWLLRPALILLLLLSAGCSYFMNRFHVVIDQTMMLNALQTDRREAAELMGWPLLMHLLVYGLLPAILVALVPLRRASALRETAHRLGLVLLMLSATLACVFVQYRSVSSWARNHADMRMYPNPVYPLYAASKFLHRAMIPSAEAAPQQIGRDAVRIAAPKGARPRVVILVLGETARAANFQLDGYPRATNPQLAAMGDVLNFSNVWSCGTSTAVSVPCMFSAGGQENFDKDAVHHQENLLDLVQHAGVDVLWRNNNSGCKEVCLRVPTEDLSHAGDPAYCTSEGCHDEILLRGLADLLDSGHDRLIVLHTLGSHGPSYYKRVPAEFRSFQPACENDDLQQCSTQQIVNAYDNTIVYADHLLARLITLLHQHEDRIDSSMIYLSDHGESLGENGLYLHGMPYRLAPDLQKQVPMIAWFSQGMQQAQGFDSACLRRSTGERRSHDNLFSTLLGLLSIRTGLYRAELDLLRECRAGPAVSAAG